MRIGTRGSALALAQAGQVAAMVPGAQLVTITTSGDLDRAAGDKEKWVRELDRALLDGEIDLAVHSAKDVPAALPDGLVIAGAPARADARDALCGASSIAALEPGARIGTSSLRRAAQLRALRDDLDVVELRGNVDTRLRRLDEGAYAAIIVALAGLQRLGRADAAGAALDELIPAAGQGVLALATRADDDRARSAVRALTDAHTLDCLTAERALVRALSADCDTPVGAHAVRAPSGDGLRLRAFVGREDGSAWLVDEHDGEPPEALGIAVAGRLRAAGADEVLGR